MALVEFLLVFVIPGSVVQLSPHRCSWPCNGRLQAPLLWKLAIANRPVTLRAFKSKWTRSSPYTPNCHDWVPFNCLTGHTDSKKQGDLMESYGADGTGAFWRRQFLGVEPSSRNVQHGSQEGLVGNPVDEYKYDFETTFPAPQRLIAIGDMHGDLKKAKEALLVAQVMDQKEQWVGGETVVVQVGDLLDRAGDEIKIIYLLEKLKIGARRAGGEIHIMNGNHEVLNVDGDFRYVTSPGLDEFQHWSHWYKMGMALKQRCAGLPKPYDPFVNLPDHLGKRHLARVAALRPGGPIASRFLAPHPMVLVVGGSLFVHGGLLLDHIDYGLDKINSKSREWMEGKSTVRPPKFLRGPQSLVWLRDFSHEEADMCNCDDLIEILNKVPGAKRMVVGHTVQFVGGVNGVCDNQAVRVDVGMSKGCGNGRPEVLQILNDTEMTVLGLAESADESKARVKPKSKRGSPKLGTPEAPAVKVPVNFQTSHRALSILGDTFLDDSFLLRVWMSTLFPTHLYLTTSLSEVYIGLSTQVLGRLRHLPETQFFP